MSRWHALRPETRAALALLALVAVVGLASLALAQVYVIDPAGEMTAAPAGLGPVTWVHVADPYAFDDDGNPTAWRHHTVRADLISGVAGVWPYSGSERMHLYARDDRYPTFLLPDLGGQANLDWMYAVEAVVRESPGGVVELVDYLP